MLPDLKFTWTGYCVAQVRCAFSLPAKAVKTWFSRGGEIPQYLAYIEWFTPFASLRPGRSHQMYKISRSKKQGKQQASIILIELVRQSAHLIPSLVPLHRRIGGQVLCLNNVLNSMSIYFQIAFLIPLCIRNCVYNSQYINSN
jgi:hypothetical protein